jgi:hypothetical protein
VWNDSIVANSRLRTPLFRDADRRLRTALERRSVVVDIVCVKVSQQPPSHMFSLRHRFVITDVAAFADLDWAHDLATIATERCAGARVHCCYIWGKRRTCCSSNGFPASCCSRVEGVMCGTVAVLCRTTRDDEL